VRLHRRVGDDGIDVLIKRTDDLGRRASRRCDTARERCSRRSSS
jgi:hypothetical protein